MVKEIKNEKKNTDSTSVPFAKYSGILKLGSKEIDCYVSNLGQRLISMRATVKSIADVDSGSLADYVGIEPLKPFINKDLVVAELIELEIRGNPQKAKCLEARQFLNICRAYVSALSNNSLKTERQKENAARCGILLSACADIGLEALIDEATGYQYERREDELQIKLRLYIAEELRAWEKTFPDELWEEFGRLTNWKDSLTLRPKWWGKLVIELIYNTLDSDVAKYLRENKPPTGIHWHRQLTENYGVRQLVSRCYEIIGMAKTCNSISELREKVAYHYKKVPMQIDFLQENLSQFNKNLKKAIEYNPQ